MLFLILLVMFMFLVGSAGADGHLTAISVGLFLLYFVALTGKSNVKYDKEIGDFWER
jgi:hypothetical protein